MNKTFTFLILTLLLGSVTTSTMAHEVGPDETVRLLEAGKIKSFEELNKIALVKHPGSTIEETELEDEYGVYVYEIELLDVSGQEWVVSINATTGDILKNYQDN